MARLPHLVLETRCVSRRHLEAVGIEAVDEADLLLGRVARHRTPGGAFLLARVPETGPADLHGEWQRRGEGVTTIETALRELPLPARSGGYPLALGEAMDLLANASRPA